MQQHWNIRRPLAALVTAIMAIAGLVALEAPAHAADAGYKGPFYGQAAGTTAGSVPGAPTAQKPQSKLWFAHGSWWGALWNETSDNRGERFTIHRYDWGANQWVDTGVELENRARSDLDVLWDGSHLYVVSNSDANSTTTVTAHSVELSRYSYAGGTYAPDWSAPVTIATDFVYSPVIEKDSTGMLWMTYTQGTQVKVTHSVSGNDQSWVAPYPLPTPNNESTVAGTDTTGDDPATQSSGDIASIVSFDGNKIGVLWSNQRTDTVYWASHTDGAPQGQWSTGVAYSAPEGADDHISLKSVTGTDGGRVYAVTKTSMNGAEPIFQVLVLRLNGAWDHFPYASADTNLTRPIILLHPAKQELYVFAAAGESASSGGSIYYKKTSMTSPDFGSLDSRGTLFIADSSLTTKDPGQVVEGQQPNTERINNPSSTKQNLSEATGLLVLANNDPTDYYYYNRMSLTDPPPDTTAPDTTITDAVTEGTSATFTFSSSEPGTFECKLDGAAWEPCASPKGYTGLVAGDHTFSVRAKDAAGNTDATPATRTWTVTAPSTGGGGGGGGSAPPPSGGGGGSTPPPDDGGSTPPPSAPEPDGQVLFADDFSSGLDGWRSYTAGDGNVSVKTGAVHTEDDGAVLRTSGVTGSAAVLSKGLARSRALEIRWSALITRDPAAGTSRLIRVRDTSGRVVLTVLRRAATDRLVVRDLAGATVGAARMPIGSVSSLRLVLRQRAGRDAWSLSVNGRVVSTTAARTGGADLLAIAFGTNGGKRLSYRIDDVMVMRP